MKNIEAAIAAILESDYADFGIRAIDDVIEVGEACPNSRVWDNGYVTDDTLDGASATMIKPKSYSDAAIRTALEVAEKANKPYYAKHHYIIASNNMRVGEDAREGIYRDAVVVAVID